MHVLCLVRSFGGKWDRTIAPSAARQWRPSAHGYRIELSVAPASLVLRLRRSFRRTIGHGCSKRLERKPILRPQAERDGYASSRQTPEIAITATSSQAGSIPGI